jgi:hypothetical protein
MMVRRKWAKRERDGEEKGRGKEESKPRVSPILRIIVQATRRCKGRRRRGGGGI